MTELVQGIGAVMGLAAVVGVAALWALRFTQGRDVKRLREWAFPWETVPRQRFWSGRISGRYVAVALVLVGAYGITQLAGDERSPSKPKRKRAPINPGNVTVAVLNGTTVDGLAATLRDQLAAAGFKKGTIDVFSDQQLAESVVQYAPGHQAAAKAVSQRIGISQREPVTANSRALAGDATVIVIAGADKAP